MSASGAPMDILRAAARAISVARRATATAISVPCALADQTDARVAAAAAKAMGAFSRVCQASPQREGVLGVPGIIAARRFAAFLKAQT